MDAGEQPPPTTPRRKRPFCSRCSKPASVCLCSRLAKPPLDNPVGVTILQHAMEAKHALNSARVASLGLRNVAVVPVTDVLFHAEYTVLPFPSDPPGAGGGGLSALALGKISNAAALRGAVSGTVLATHLNADDDVDDNGSGHHGDGSCDRRWSGEAPREEYRSDGFSPNANCCPKAQNGIITGVSTAAEALTAAPARNGVIIDAQFQPKRSDLYPSEGPPGSEEGSMVVNSALCKVFCSSSKLWFSLEPTAKPDLSWVSGKPFGKAATSNGFSVRKLQRRQLKGSTKLEEVDEFGLVIPPGSALLFPGKSSIEVGAVDFEVKHLIVLDGTWDKAKRMYYENPWLQFLPQLKLEPKAESLYSEVRHQPKPGCLSTIESIVYAMKGLGSDIEGLDNLLDVFKSMVGDQRRCKDENFRRLSRS